MTRRALIFAVPKGKETHYSKIQGPIIGSVWAPLYHAYGYYMPGNTSPDAIHENARLKENSKDGLMAALATVLSCAVFGVKPLIRAAVGGVLWSEFESAFATWDGHVTFGSSQLDSHAAAFYVFSALRETCAKSATHCRSVCTYNVHTLTLTSLPPRNSPLSLPQTG